MGRVFAPVINLKGLNSFLQYTHFKMEGNHLLRDLVQPGDWLGKIDLKDAYFVIPIWTGHRKYLPFLHRKYLPFLHRKYLRLPFGLALAPILFTKILKPVVALLRRAGIRLIIYLDDLLFMHATQEGVREDMATARHLLENLGLVINLEKSVFVPTQKLEFLGFIIHTIDMILVLPDDKVKSIKSLCRTLLGQQLVSVRDLSQLIGKLKASIQAVFPAPLHYRHLQHLKNQGLAMGSGYDSCLPLSREAREEIGWWLVHLEAWNGRAILSTPPDLVIETDASKIGWGAACQGVRTGGLWSQKEKKLHINCLELLAGSFAVKSFTNDRLCAHARLRMDNTTAVAYVNRLGGAHSLVLSNLALALWEWAQKHNILLSMRGDYRQNSSLNYGMR